MGRAGTRALGFRTAEARVQTLGAADRTMQGTYWYDLTARKPVAARWKRLLDLAIAAPIVTVCAPLLFLRPLMRERRVGFRGREFDLYVFGTGPLRTLPHFLNVLEGSLSLVGPRPLAPEDARDRAARRFSVRPGLTGPWRVVEGDERELDRCYVNEWSVGRDLAILLRTAVQRHRAAPTRSASGRE